VVEEDAGLFGEFAAGGVGEGLAGVSAAAGQLPPVVIGLVGVFGVDKQHTVAVVEQQDAGADPECGGFGGGGRHPGGRSLRRRQLVVAAGGAHGCAAWSEQCWWGAGGGRRGGYQRFARLDG
jgi:hypothetical protein